MNKKMVKYIVFLRGVMPTGKNKVPMAELKVVLEKNHFEEVRTYIQSGNVILATTKKKNEIEIVFQELIKKNFGGDIPCIAKTLKEMEVIFDKNPFSKKHQLQTYFTFFKNPPDKIKLMEFLKLDFSQDKVEIIGDVLYTKYKTKHSNSKFNNNFYERKLGIKATTRNFKTLKNVIHLLGEKKYVP
jgi:uncharacterized protein (DUF1697 family)